MYTNVGHIVATWAGDTLNHNAGGDDGVGVPKSTAHWTAPSAETCRAHSSADETNTRLDAGCGYNAAVDGDVESMTRTALRPSVGDVGVVVATKAKSGMDSTPFGSVGKAMVSRSTGPPTPPPPSLDKLTVSVRPVEVTVPDADAAYTGGTHSLHVLDGSTVVADVVETTGVNVVLAAIRSTWPPWEAVTVTGVGENTKPGPPRGVDNNIGAGAPLLAAAAVCM